MTKNIFNNRNSIYSRDILLQHIDFGEFEKYAKSSRTATKFDKSN